jgi:hypothetical protein
MRKFDPMNETPLGLLLKEVRILKERVDSDLADNYPPHDKVTRGDIIAAVKGKKGKKDGVKSKPKKDEAGSYKSNRGMKGKGSDDKMGCKMGDCKMDDCPTCGGKRVKKAYGDAGPDVHNSATRFMDVTGGEQVQSVGGYQGNQTMPNTNDGPKRTFISEVAKMPAYAQTGYDVNSNSLHMHLTDVGARKGGPNTAAIEDALGSLRKSATHGQMGLIDEIGNLIEKVYSRL